MGTGDRTHGYDFNSLGLEGLGRGLVGIAGDGANLELLGQDGIGKDGVDDGAALVAGGSEDGEDLRHGCDCQCFGLSVCMLSSVEDDLSW